LIKSVEDSNVFVYSSCQESSLE